MSIVITMDENDFQALATSIMHWAGGNWPAQDGRFELTRGPRFDAMPKWSWRAAYWLGAEYATVVLARAYLLSAGAEYEIIYDKAMTQYVILTDYETAAFKEHPDSDK